MNRVRLTAEHITELALQLALLSSRRAVGQVDLHYRQVEGALRWHRWSCQPIQVVRRLIQAAFSQRLLKCVALLRQQTAMLRLAADDGSDVVLVLEALVALSTSVAQYELGPNPTPKQRIAFAACEVPALRARFAQLVRGGQIDSSPAGLRLLHATRRRIAAYAVFALFAGWSGLLFVAMAIRGTLDLQHLAGYLCGSVLISAYLTRGLFTELRADQQTVLDLNSHLKPQRAVHEKPTT